MLTDLDLLLTTVLGPDDDLLTERAKSPRWGIPRWDSSASERFTGMWRVDPRGSAHTR